MVFYLNLVEEQKGMEMVKRLSLIDDIKELVKDDYLIV